MSDLIDQRAYSMSRLRTFYSGCSYKYFLRYLQGYRGTYSSAVWLGSIVHTLIQQAYHGMPLAEAHRRVWLHACGSIYQELDIWYCLDLEYQAAGKAHTKARALWLEQHPAYTELARSIEAYRDEFLSEGYTWAKTASLTEYYRWSRRLMTLPRTHILLPYAVLVEGQSLLGPDGEPASHEAAQVQYHLLRGTLDGLPVVGVPDVVAVDPQGVVWIADYKVMSHLMTQEETAGDGQLNLYVHLLRQAGRIAPDQPVHIGHIYPTERQGVQQVWARPSPDALALLTTQVREMDRVVRARVFLPVRGIAVGAMSPCARCEVAEVCRTSLSMNGETP